VTQPVAAAVSAAAHAVRDTPFAEVLRRARAAPGRLEELRGWGVPEALQGWQLSFDPALQRTVAAVFSMHMMGEELPPPAREWVLWVTDAMRAMQRIAAKCWAGVPRDIRKEFLDYDNVLPPAMSGEIADLRGDEPGRPSLRFEGLDRPDVAEALREVYGAVRASETAEAAGAAARQVEVDPTLRRVLSEVWARLGQDIRTVRAGETGAQAFARARRTVAGAYDGTAAETVVRSLRHHNTLVTRVLWMLLGAAEQLELAVFDQTAGPVTERAVDGSRHVFVTVTTDAAALVRPTHPVWLQSGSPFDGLYVVQGHTFAFAGSEENDFKLEPFGA
jgi:hypothetical protein